MKLSPTTSRIFAELCLLITVLATMPWDKMLIDYGIPPAWHPYVANFAAGCRFVFAMLTIYLTARQRQQSEPQPPQLENPPYPPEPSKP